MNRKRSYWRIVISLTIGALFVSQCWGADVIYIGAQGRLQGVFRGAPSGVTQGMVPATKFAFDVHDPFDPSTGQITGRRQYSPVRVTKLLDASSVQYMQAAAANEVLTNVTINFLASDQAGKVFVVRSLVLTNALVVAVEHYSEPDATGASVVMEQISFNFQKYTWNETVGGLSMSDSVGGPS